MSLFKSKIFLTVAFASALAGMAHADDEYCGCLRMRTPAAPVERLAFEKARNNCLKECLDARKQSSNKRGGIFYSVLPRRCERDSLSIPQARGRIQWAIRVPTISQAEANYLSAEIGRDRPRYPTYGVWSEEKQTYTYPSEWRAPVDGGASPEVPSGYEIMGLCTAGCYTAGAKLWYKNGYENIDKLTIFEAPEVYTLTKDSTIERPRFQLTHVGAFTRSVSDATQEIVDIFTESGRTLSVTTNHPVMLTAGIMVEAKTLKIGDELFSVDGSGDRIVRTELKTLVGKVFNVDIASNELAENVVVAEGLLNGAIYYQNEGVKDLNRVFMRRSLKQL